MTVLDLDSDGLVIVDQPRRAGPEGRVQLRPIKTIRQQRTRKHEERVHERYLVLPVRQAPVLPEPLLSQVEKRKAVIDGIFLLTCAAAGELLLVGVHQKQPWPDCLRCQAG